MPGDAVQLTVALSFTPHVPVRSQRALHVESQVGVLGGSHCSPAPASTQASPHDEVTQLLVMSQMRRGLVWQTSPCASGAPAWHVLPPVTVAHVSEPLQGLPSEQLAFDVHSNLQLLVQPLPDCPFCAALSHSSPAVLSTTPLPHSAGTHAPLSHVPGLELILQAAPFAAGSDGFEHVCAVVLQMSEVHALPSTHWSLAAHVNVQSLRQPSWSLVFASSHCSPAPESTMPSLHVDATQL